MAINITSVSGVISVSQSGGTSKSYFGQAGRFTCMADNTTFQIFIGGDPYTVPFSNLTVNGQSPTTLTEAFTLLGSVFQPANSSSGGSGSSYLVYSGNLTQAGTSAPTCTPNQNTLTGTITFSYSSPGNFSLESTLEDFPDAAKVEIFYPSIVEPAGSFVIITRQTSSSINIKTYEAQGDGSYSLANGYLTNWPFEIRVHP